jgi:rhodanese-related sulfurtransferase
MENSVKKECYNQIARVTKALSSPARLEIIDILSQGEKSVEVLAENTGLSIKNASAQLKELKAALLVISRKEGKFVYYRLSSAAVSHLWLDIRKFSATHFLEMQKFSEEVWSGTEELTLLDRKELLARARKGEVIVLDVRPQDEFKAGHIPYAVSIPIDDLQEQLQNLPKGKEIIAYCRGSYCVWARDAAHLLRKNGFQARHIRDGVQDWTASGLPIKPGKVIST